MVFSECPWLGSRKGLFFPAPFREGRDGPWGFQFPGQVGKIFESPVGFFLGRGLGFFGFAGCRGVFCPENLFHVIKKILTGHRRRLGFFGRGMKPAVVADDQEFVLASGPGAVVQKSLFNFIIRLAIGRKADMDPGFVARFRRIQKACGDSTGPGIFGVEHHEDSFRFPGKRSQV